MRLLQTLQTIAIRTAAVLKSFPHLPPHISFVYMAVVSNIIKKTVLGKRSYLSKRSESEKLNDTCFLIRKGVYVR